MNVDPIAATYARALLEAALDKGNLEEVLEEATFFGDLVRKDPDLRLFVENPRLERVTKKNVLESALRGKVSDTFLNFLLVLIDKGRQHFLDAILEEFHVLYDKEVGIVRAEAISAVPMTEEALAALEARMVKGLDKKIVISNRVDPDILGGIVVRFDGMLADGSLKTALSEIRSKISAPKFGSELVHEN